MGKVLSAFKNGYPGSIARSVDDVVTAFANKSNLPIPFGKAVVISENKDGVVPFDPTVHTGENFVGVAVRAPSKTPDTYGSSTGSYAPGELVDVITRGHVVVEMANSTGGLGSPVSIYKTNGKFIATTTTGENYIPLPNVHLSARADGDNRAEILINTRAIL